MMNRVINYYRALTHFYGAVILVVFHTCLVIASFYFCSDLSKIERICLAMSLVATLPLYPIKVGRLEVFLYYLFIPITLFVIGII